MGCVVDQYVRKVVAFFECGKRLVDFVLVARG